MSKLLKLGNNEIKKMSIEDAFKQFEKFLWKLTNYWRHTYNIEDIFQVASVGFIKAYKEYDITKGIKFMTYLGTTVLNEIRMYHRSNKKLLMEESIEKEISMNGDGKSLNILDTLEDETNYEDMAVKNVVLDKIVEISKNCLTDIERNIIIDYFVKDMTQTAIAEKYNRTQSSVSKLKLSGLRKLKIKYESGEEELEKGENEKSMKTKCFEYFSEHDNEEKSKLIEEVNKLCGCTINTAEYYYYKWKSCYMSGQYSSVIHTDVTTNGAVLEIKKEDIKESFVRPKKGALQISEIRGNLMDYDLFDNGKGFNMKRPNGRTVMPLYFSEIDELIVELQAVLKAMKGDGKVG